MYLIQALNALDSQERQLQRLKLHDQGHLRRAWSITALTIKVLNEQLVKMKRMTSGEARVVCKASRTTYRDILLNDCSVNECARHGRSVYVKDWERLRIGMCGVPKGIPEKLRSVRLSTI